MNLLSGFEQRLERAVDGFFAKIFKSGVHPVEIGKRLLRVMEDGKTVALKRTYVPNVYRILLSDEDFERLAPLEPKLIEELEVFVSEAARQREWVLADSPRVSFDADQELGRGEFRVQAEAVVLDGKRRRRKEPAPAAWEERPPSPRSASLVVLADDEPVKTIPIEGRISIGRQSGNDLVVSDPGVSRNHAQVLLGNKGGCLLRDLGSTNGTIINGTKLESRAEHRLREGDRITVGHTVIEFRRG